MKKKPKQKKENSERWLLTYADLITLLMILFILLFAMSSVSETKYDKLSDSLSDAMGEGASIFGNFGSVLPEGGGSVIDLGGSTNNGENNDGQGTPATPTPTEIPSSEEDSDTTGADTTEPGATEDLSGTINNKEDMGNFESYVNDILSELNLGVSADTTMIESGLVITFANDVFFDSGQDSLKPEMKKGLKEIAKLLNKIDNPILIEGHTDNVPISSTNKFTSNWQLSSVRAANVAQYLVDNEKLDGTRLAAIGYGEYHPLESNSTKEGRSKNRRVDIIILYKEGSNPYLR